MRKLCTHELAGVKMKKNERKIRFAIPKKRIFSTALWWLLL